jgi:hypothetical protein
MVALDLGPNDLDQLSQQALELFRRGQASDEETTASSDRLVPVLLEPDPVLSTWPPTGVVESGNPRLPDRAAVLPAHRRRARPNPPSR